MKLSEITVGMRVVGVDPHGPDTEAGRVLDLNPGSAVGEVLVGWEQGTRTWTDAASLVPEPDYRDSESPDDCREWDDPMMGGRDR